MTTTERERALFGIWKRVNELADIEDEKAIRGLLAEAGINGLMHIGTPKEDFTPAMVAEWALGNWANIIDGMPETAWMLNTTRNISFSQYEQIVGREIGEADG